MVRSLYLVQSSLVRLGTHSFLEVMEVKRMESSDVVVLVDVEIPPDPNGSVGLVFWSYGRSAFRCTYKDGPFFDLFMRMCASMYVTNEFGWKEMKLVSGPNLVGPSEYMFVFRRADGGDKLGSTSESVAVNQESSG
jgi:hypothetical protein